MQRLFSTFPDGVPGLGLLLLRPGAAITLICLAAVDLTKPAGETSTISPDVVAAVAGVFLLIGLWAPLVGALIAADQLWIAVSLHASPRDSQWIQVLLAVLAAGVAMLGPGAWSVDARLFGRKRFEIGARASDQ